MAGTCRLKVGMLSKRLFKASERLWKKKMNMSMNMHEDRNGYKEMLHGTILAFQMCIGDPKSHQHIDGVGDGGVKGRRE